MWRDSRTRGLPSRVGTASSAASARSTRPASRSGEAMTAESSSCAAGAVLGSTPSTVVRQSRPASLEPIIEKSALPSRACCARVETAAPPAASSPSAAIGASTMKSMPNSRSTGAGS